MKNNKIAEIFNAMNYGPAPESNSNVLNWLKKYEKSSQIFINGEWQKATTKNLFDSCNPATGEKLAKIAQSTNKQVDSAVASARQAQKSWSEIGGKARAKYLYAIARLLQKRSRELAVLESMDNGKPIRETRDVDIPLAIRHFYHHAGWAQLMGSGDEFNDFEPLGVVGQIIPWNFPLLMMAWKIAPAIAAGNCVVIKPAEYTSLTALMFAEILEEVGLPKGVVNIVTGDGKVGAQIVEHPDVNKIAFTGSTNVGKMIRRQTAGTGKKLTLELGGKSAFIVFDDADIDSAIEGVVDAIWFNQGQVCCAGSRLLVQEGIEELFIKKLKKRMNTLRIGDPLDKCTDIGAIVDPSQKARIESLVTQSVKEGATLYQAKTSTNKANSKGCFYPPSLLCDIETSNTAANVEIFGPVLSVMSFRHQPEAIQLANNSKYGLAASVWSENINRALDVAPQIKAGVVWINTTNQFDAACGFGGYKESGMGREGGKEGMYEYLKVKACSAPKNMKKAKGKLQKVNSSSNLFNIDQTAKMYINGKQARPDNGNTLIVNAPDGSQIGRVSDGSRKDIRNAVEAAFKACSWSKTTGHLRAQILYYFAENLNYRKTEFCQRIIDSTHVTQDQAENEFDTSIERLFTFAAWADKYDGSVHQPPIQGVALAMNEAIGVMGIACPDESPLLAFISLLAPAIAMGNRVVIIPSQTAPLVATDLYQVLETSDMPSGVVNIVTGNRDLLSKVLAEHDQVEAIWYQGTKEGSEMIELASADNLKRTWVNDGKNVNWMNADNDTQYLRASCQVKNIWIPYGD